MNAWKWAVLLSALGVVACSSVNSRKERHLAEYNALPASERALVERGQIQNGMDSNAVYIAWGPPSRVVEKPPPPTAQTIWVYSVNRAVLQPTWTYRPDPNGYFTLEPTTEHHSVRDTKAEVVFENGKVVQFRKY